MRESTGSGTDLSDAEIQALAVQLMRSGDGKVSQAGAETKLLGPGQKRVSRGQLKRVEGLRGVGLNQTIKIEIELPAYLVAGMRSRDEFSYREAVRDYLIGKGQTWWQPRFMAAIKAKEIEAARKRFTRGLG